jgi:hypothetical protein
MDLTLKRILKSKRTRRANRGSNWYKKSSGGPCPNINTKQQMVNSYWYEFGCQSHNRNDIKLNRSRKARNCASERMAEMYNRPINSTSNASHIPPIKLTYNLALDCVRDNESGFSTYYKQQFRKLYNELINNDRSNPRHITFQTKLGNGLFPLENPIR